MSDFDSVWWEWYCSLFPSSKHEIIDPREWRCECGYRWHFGLVSKIRMLLFGSMIFTCPNCYRKKKFRIITNIVRDTTDEKELIEWNRRINSVREVK